MPEKRGPITLGMEAGLGMFAKWKRLVPSETAGAAGLLAPYQ